MVSRRELLAGVGAAGVGTVGVAALAGYWDDNPDPVGHLSATPGETRSYEWPTGGADLRNTRSFPDGIGPRDDVTAEWSIDLDASHITAEPTTDGDVLLLTTATGVVAFDTEDGERLWSTDRERDALTSGSFTYSGSSTIHGETAYITDHRTLIAVDLYSGDRRWEYEFDYPFENHSPALVEPGYRFPEHRVFAGAGEYVRAFDATTGEVLWERRLFGIVEGTFASPHSDPLVDLFVATRGGALYALDYEGRVLWRRTLPAGISTGPTVVRGGVRSSASGSSGRPAAVVGCTDGYVYCYDTHGSREWRTAPGTPGVAVNDGIATAYGVVYVQDGKDLYAFGADLGDKGWEVDTGVGRHNPPILLGDTVYAGGDRLHAIAVAGGADDKQPSAGATRFEYGEDDLGVPYVIAAGGRLYAVAETSSYNFELRALS